MGLNVSDVEAGDIGTVQTNKRSLRALFCGHQKYWFQAQFDDASTRMIVGQCKKCNTEVRTEVPLPTKDLV